MLGWVTAQQLLITTSFVLEGDFGDDRFDVLLILFGYDYYLAYVYFCVIIMTGVSA